MSTIIGSKYEKKKSELVDRIRKNSVYLLDNDSVALLKLHGKFACYFCCDTVTGRLRVIEEIIVSGGVQSKIHYAICTDCFAGAKGMYLVK
ncbi:MAG: hypothetical protein ABIF10_01795 [Candidatus Woesearchaeota archaeon]